MNEINTIKVGKRKRSQAQRRHLLGGGLLSGLVDTVVSDLVSALGGGNDAQVVAELALLEELLGQRIWL